jgi:hypothetical protein
MENIVIEHVKIKVDFTKTCNFGCQIFILGDRQQKFIADMASEAEVDSPIFKLNIVFVVIA